MFAWYSFAGVEIFIGTGKWGAAVREGIKMVEYRTSPAGLFRSVL